MKFLKLKKATALFFAGFGVMSTIFCGSAMANPEVENGFIGMKRDIILKLCKFLDENKTSMVIGMCQEHYNWKRHKHFLIIRYELNNDDVPKTLKVYKELPPIPEISADGQIDSLHEMCELFRQRIKILNDIYVKLNNYCNHHAENKKARNSLMHFIVLFSQIPRLSFGTSKIKDLVAVSLENGEYSVTLLASNQNASWNFIPFDETNHDLDIIQEIFLELDDEVKIFSLKLFQIDAFNESYDRDLPEHAEKLDSLFKRFYLKPFHHTSVEHFQNHHANDEHSPNLLHRTFRIIWPFSKK